MRDDPYIGLLVVLAPLSIASIGGATAIYAPLQYEAVDVRQWVTGAQFLDMFAMSRFIPGPSSILGALIGFKIAGILGALVAMIALYLPSFLDGSEKRGRDTDALKKGSWGGAFFNWVGNYFGVDYESEDGYKLQPSSGLKMMERAAAQGNVEAILAVARMYVQDVYMNDTRKARDWYQRAAELGSADAMKALSEMDAEKTE
jgi:hypothetical protein